MLTTRISRYTKASAVALMCLWVTQTAHPSHAQLSTAATQIRESLDPPFGPPLESGRFGQVLAAADFNGDGFDDLAVSRSESSEERVYILNGGGPELQFHQLLLQFGTSDFGLALATCDLNQDGFDDLIVGAPDTDVNGNNSSGAIFVYAGSATGLTAIQGLTEDDISGPDADGSEFGASLSTGDYDDDGNCDVAVSAPEKDELGTDTSVNRAGQVTVLFGDGTGFLETSSALEIRQFLIPVSGGPIVPTSGNEFGTTLATLPSNGPFGNDALLVGLPGYSTDEEFAVGQVWLVKFTGRDLLSGFVLDLDEVLPALDAQGQERFGTSIVVGQFLQENEPFIAIGAPGLNALPGILGGAVFFTTATRIQNNGSSFGYISQGPGFAGVPESGEDFGHALTVGDFNADGWSDLVIGVPGDRELTPTRGASALKIGGFHVLYGSAVDLAIGPYLNESDFGQPLEIGRLGESTAVGDFLGNGADSLVVGAPRKNGVVAPSRGGSPTDDHGVVYLLQNLHTPTAAPLQVRTGLPLPGDGAIIARLSAPAASTSGSLGFRAGSEENDSVVVVDGSIVFEDSSSAIPLVGEANGFVLAAEALWAFDDEPASAGGLQTRVLIGPSGLIASSDDLADGGGLVGHPEQFVAAGDRVYFRATDPTSPNQRIFSSAPGFNGPPQRVLGTGDSQDGLFVKTIDHFGISEDRQHLIYTGVLGVVADNSFVMLDGVRLVGGGQSLLGQPSLLFGRWASVNNRADFVFAAVLANDANAVFGGSQSIATWVLSAFDAVDGYLLTDMNPVMVSIGESGHVLQLWEEELPNRGGVFIDARSALVATCRSASGVVSQHLALRTGEAIDLNGNGQAAAVVRAIYAPESPEGLEIVATPQGAGDVVYLRLGLEEGIDNFDAIVQLALPCPLFTDGFESGDLEGWSSSTL